MFSVNKNLGVKIRSLPRHDFSKKYAKRPEDCHLTLEIENIEDRRKKVSAISTGLALEGFDSFSRDEGDHNQGCDGIGPREAENRVHDQAPEEDCGQVGTELCLLRVGMHGGTVEMRGDFVLGAGEQRHDQKGGTSQDNTGNAVRGHGVAEDR